MQSLVRAVLVSFVLALSPVSAHWYISCFGPGTGGCVEGASQNPFDKAIGDNGLLQTAPIAPADTNPQMKCGTMGVPTDAVEPIKVSPGASMMAQFLHDTGAAWDVRMNANHHGFANVYLAPYSSAGQGQVWTKIYADGLQPTTNQEKSLWANPANTDSCTTGAVPADQCTVVPFAGWWATDKLRMNHGVLPFTLPSSLPSGKYILRGELLTTYLPNTVSTAQGYIGCSVIQVGEGGDQSAPLPNAVDIPGAYAGSAWMHYDLYSKWINGADNPPSDLPGNPGPPVWSGGSTGSGTVGGPTSIVPSGTGSPTASRRRRRVV